MSTKSMGHGLGFVLKSKAAYGDQWFKNRHYWWDGALKKYVSMSGNNAGQQRCQLRMWNSAWALTRPQLHSNQVSPVQRTPTLRIAKSALKMHQSAPKVYQNCTKNAPKVYQKCTSDVSLNMKVSRNVWPCVFWMSAQMLETPQLTCSLTWKSSVIGACCEKLKPICSRNMRLRIHRHQCQGILCSLVSLCFILILLIVSTLLYLVQDWVHNIEGSLAFVSPATYLPHSRFEGTTSLVAEDNPKWKAKVIEKEFTIASKRFWI